MSYDAPTARGSQMRADPLDIDAVSAFVIVTELKSFTRAAQVLGGTQSAISLRIKRLEDRLGRRLLERTPRLVRLSADGAAFLGVARGLLDAHNKAASTFEATPVQIRLGVSDHLVGPDLSAVLKSLATSDPALRINLRIACTHTVRAAYESGGLDVAFVLGRNADEQDAHHLGSEPLLWVSAPDYEPRAGEPIRVALYSEKCSLRAVVADTLDRADVAWDEASTGGGLGAVSAAVTAGLAVAAMTRRTAPGDSVSIAERLRLPDLPNPEIVMLAKAQTTRTERVLNTLAASFTVSQSAAPA